MLQNKNGYLLWMREIGIRYRDQLQEFSQSSVGKRIGKVLNWFVMIGVAFWLFLQLQELGWRTVFNSMPTQPLFYLLLLVGYFMLPITEQIIYRFFWTFDFWSGFKAFTLKKIYNLTVIGYSGEVYFFHWVHTKLKKPKKEVFKIIKDNNVISTISSTFVVVCILGYFIWFGYIPSIELIAYFDVFLNTTAFVFTILLVVVIIKFRKHIISFPFKTAMFLFGIHTLRFLLTQVLQVLMWMVVLPDVSVDVWLIYVATGLVLGRIPVLPNKDLIFMGMVIQLSSNLNVPEASMAALMLSMSIANRMLNFGFFGVIFLITSFKPKSKGSFP